MYSCILKCGAALVLLSCTWKVLTVSDVLNYTYFFRYLSFFVHINLIMKFDFWVMFLPSVIGDKAKFKTYKLFDFLKQKVYKCRRAFKLQDNIHYIRLTTRFDIQAEGSLSFVFCLCCLF